MNMFDRQTQKDLIQTFEEVKSAVKKTENRSRAGLMLGLQDLGSSMQGFIGGYYPVESNLIVLNKAPLRRINETDQMLFKPYTFHVLLHEYIHSLGLLDEALTRQKTYEVSRKCFGEQHLVTEFAKNMNRFFPNLVYPVYGWKPAEYAPIEIVPGFDRSSTQTYIA